MARKVKPTPVPWRSSDWPVYHPKRDDQFRATIVDSRGHGVFQAMAYNESPKARANIDLVLRATENHEKLLTVIDELVEAAGLVQADISETDTGWFFQFAAKIDNARWASRRAKGEI